MDKLNTPEHEKDAIRQQIVLRFWPVGVLFFCIFTPISFFISGDFLSGWFLLGTFVFFIVGMLIYARTKNIHLISNMLAILGIPVLLPWLITGGPARSGFWWSLVYVVWAFSVTSQRSALFWLSVHVISSTVLVILGQKGLISIAYSLPELLNILFGFAVTLTLVYLFSKVLLYYLELANKRAELILINRELVSENRGLTSENRGLEQFAYVASHDLQEPLRNITNFAGLLENRLGKNANDEEVRYILSVIAKSADRMKVLIRDLLSFSKIGRERIRERVACAKLFNEVLADMSTVIRESKANIQAENLPDILGNRTEIKQLFQNLLSNALKFQKAGDPPQITVRCEAEAGYWKFSISDNGIGIQDEHLEKIFLIFQRLHAENEYSGTGIGLAICKKIIEAAEGKIWVTSTPGVGSVFFFTIPK